MLTILVNNVYIQGLGNIRTEPGSCNGFGEIMWISRRTDYATRAILTLTIAGGGPLKLEELSHRTDVPLSVLEQIMPLMRTAGIVRSDRGRHGGYRLNAPPEEISMERVVRVFEGQLAPIACATRKHPEECSMMAGCSLLPVWQQVRDATITILSDISFAELAAQASERWRPLAAPTIR